jgi:hypothetical protein
MAFVILGTGVAAIALTSLGDSPATDTEGATARALAMWSRSCSAPSDGLCVAHETATAPHCGPDSKGTLVVRDRSALEAMEARSQLTALARRAPSAWTRHDDTRVQLALADDELERFLALAFPSGLDFGSDGSNKEASTRRFEAWIRTKSEMAERLRARYGQIAKDGDPAGSIVAASRMGLIASSFSEAIFFAEIPVDVRTGDDAQDKIDAYCDALTTVAEPLESTGADMFGTCVAQARSFAHQDELREISDAARPCVAELVRSRPEEYPSLDEAFDAPDRTRMQLQLGVADEVRDGASYDQHNTRGVALRIARDYDGAHAAYAQAVALDSSRPEALYNLGLLETFEASHCNAKEQVAALQLSEEHYQGAVDWFTRAAAHATGSLQRDATERASDAQKTIAQLRAFEVQLQAGD